MFYDAKQINQMANGLWNQLIPALTGCDVAQLAKRHGPCPACGGDDRFRFDDLEGRGTWYCNQCGGKDHRGGAGDAIDLIMRINCWDFKTALNATAAWLNAPGETSPEIPRWKSVQINVPEKPPEEWVPLETQPEDMVSALIGPKISIYNIDKKRQSKIAPQHVAVLRRPNGSLFGAIVRFVINKKKLPLPAMVCTNKVTGEIAWCFHALPDNRPLYGCEDFIPENTVLLVQGERKCDLARDGIDGYDVCSIVGGDGAICHMDFSSLAASRVLIWPDNDQSGKRCAERLKEMINSIAASVEILSIPSGKPEKWDVGDAIETDKWDAEKLTNYLQHNEDYAQTNIPPVISVDACDEPEPIQNAGSTDSNYVDFTRNKRGKILATIENFHLMCVHYGVKLGIDLIKDDQIVSIPGKTEEYNKANTDLAQMISFAEEIGFTSSLVRGYMALEASKNVINPIADWIQSNAWDGIDRLQNFYDTISVRDDFSNTQKELYIRRWMCSAVSLMFDKNNPETHGILVLQGAEGEGKTSWVGSLLPKNMKDYFKGGRNVDVGNKDSLLGCLNKWIVELGELGSTLKKDLDSLKSFITDSTDEIRKPYAPMAQRNKRHTIFAATVNKENFLKDDEKNRRFWVIPVKTINAMHGIDQQQLWAQIKVLWESGEKTFLTMEEQAELAKSNDNFREADPIAELLETELDWDRDHNDWKKITATTLVMKLMPKNTPNRNQIRMIHLQLSRRGIEKKVLHGAMMFLLPPLKSERFL